MPQRINELLTLLLTEPARARTEIANLRTREPERFALLVDCMRAELEKTHATEDRPLTAEELDAAVTDLAAELRWSRQRVISEAILRLRVSVREVEAFKPVTPEETVEARRASGRYARRRSSIQAIVLGDVKALAEKHERKSERMKAAVASPGRYRGRSE